MHVPADLPRITKSDLVVDNSILSKMVCSTEGAMRHVLHLTLPNEAAELRCGSALHEGWARWLVTKDPAAGLARFDELYRPWAAEHVPVLDREGKPHSRRWKPVHRIFERWLEKEGPRFLRQFSVDPMHVEIPVWAPLGALHEGKFKSFDPENEDEVDLLRDPKHRPPVVVFAALLDAIVKKRSVGGYWSCDHKSAGGLHQWFRDRQEDASQFTGQLWAAKQRGVGPLKGVFINGMEIKSLNSSDKKCYKHGVPYHKCALEPEHHAQGLLMPITRSRHEIDAWERTAIGLTKKYIRLRRKVETIDDVRELPMEGRFIGNCSRCTFRDFCRLGRTKIAAAKFVKNEWNPLEHAFTRGGVREHAA